MLEFSVGDRVSFHPESTITKNDGPQAGPFFFGSLLCKATPV
jgi:hypothetical protein